MYRSSRKVIITSLFVFVLAFFSSRDMAAEVTASGEGPTRDQAIKSAMRNAVEQGIGTFVKSETMVQNMQLIDDKIFSHSKGYVTSYTVVKEEPSDGIIRVTIKATVDNKILKDDIEALGILRKNVGNPRILVAYSTKGESLPALKGKDFVDEIYNGIVEALTDRQFRVVDKKTSEKFSQQVAETHEIDVDLNKAAAFGLQYHAEYTLYYNVSGEVKEGVVSTGVKLRVKSQLIDNTRSQIVTSKVVEVTGSGQTLNNALEKAGRDGGKKVVIPMLDVIQKSWMEMQQSGSLYTVVIDGVDDPEEIAKFTEKFEKFPMVNSAKEVESGGGKSTFEAEYKGKRDQLDRDVLRVCKELGWTMKKIRSEGARSTWKKQ